MRNIVLITVDSLRADHLGCYGYEKNTSPFIDKLAENAMVFRSAYSNGSGTVASFPTILSSDFLSTYKDKKFLSKKRTLIQEVLKENGYVTAGFHSNPYLSKFYGYDRGFDFFYDSFEDDGNHSLIKSIKKNKKLYKFIKRISDMLPNSLIRKAVNYLKKSDEPYVGAKEINGRVIRWLKKNKHQPFFLWIHYMDVHEPYMPSQESIAQLGRKEISNKRIKRLNEYLIKNRDLNDKDLDELITLYDAEILQLDGVIQEFYLGFRELALLENSSIIITSDHGDEFKEHGGLSHIEKLYDEVLHIPLILLSPGMPPSISDKLVSLIDLSPTILGYLGLPERKEFRGGDISKGTNDYVISENTDASKISVRTKGYKLILNRTDKKYEFYDLSEDPGEQENMIDIPEDKEVIEKLKAIIEEHLLIGEKQRIKSIMQNEFKRH